MVERGWKIVSLYKERFGEHQGKWYISVCYYTGKRSPDGFGWEWLHAIRRHLSEDKLIALILNGEPEFEEAVKSLRR